MEVHPICVRDRSPRTAATEPKPNQSQTEQLGFDSGPETAPSRAAAYEQRVFQNVGLVFPQPKGLTEEYEVLGSFIVKGLENKANLKKDC